jgi:hypothetical protein
MRRGASEEAPQGADMLNRFSIVGELLDSEWAQGYYGGHLL